MQPVRAHDGAPASEPDAQRRRRRLVLVLWIGAAMLAAAGAVFLFSPYRLYEATVGRLVETGFIEPGLARFLAPLPAIAFMYAVGDLLWAVTFGKRPRAFAAAVALALLGLADAALLRHDSGGLFNPVTKRANYRWYRTEPTADDPEGRIVLVSPWWKISGQGQPVDDLNYGVAHEYERQKERARRREASYSERQRALDTEATRLSARTKDLDAEAAKLAGRQRDLDKFLERLKAAEAARGALASSALPAGIVASPASREPAPAQRVIVQSEPEEVRLGQTQPVPVGEGEYALTLRSCRKAGTSFYLYVQYLNRTAEDLDLILDRRESALFDDLGNQYEPAASRFAGDRREAELPAGLTANAILRFDGLAAGARTARVLRIGTRWSSNTHQRNPLSMGQPSTGEFRDVPLGSLTP